MARSESPSPRVAVIGSGLSAVGAIKALQKRGLRPTVIDSGEELEKDLSQKAEQLAALSPAQWKPEQRSWLNQNPTLHDGRKIPQKRTFSSGYFYGASRKEAPVEAVGNLPAFSYALGGLSCGWGASVLPPQACDLTDWPVGAPELDRYCALALDGMPYSAVEDGLSLNFPILNPQAQPLRLPRSAGFLLEALRKSLEPKKDEVVFGQSRLMIASSSTSGRTGCQYCGQCMSGCVYHSIYKAQDDILAWRSRGEIEYLPGCLVEGLKEEGEKVTVRYGDAGGTARELSFDRVFLAAGAVNSTRIVMNSLELKGEKASLRSRGGFVVPAWSLRRLPTDWPDCNTEPGLFLELKGRGLDHWVHVQVSTENELLRQKLGASPEAKGLGGRLKRFLADHLFLLFVNYHSDHSGTYELSVEGKEEAGGKNPLRSLHRKAFPQTRVLWATASRLLKIFLKIGCLPLLPFARLNSGSYHVGGTLPMKAEPSQKLDTDPLGRVRPWERIHVVDTAVFPSLPGTTIGLLTMANAYRIADQAGLERGGS